MRPFEERVGDVIAEELCHQGLTMTNLPNPLITAIQRASERLAADMESIYQHGRPTENMGMIAPPLVAKV